MKQAGFQAQPTKVLPGPSKQMTPEQLARVVKTMSKIADELAANLNRNVLDKK